jgi:hypothetical protein
MYVSGFRKVKRRGGNFLRFHMNETNRGVLKKENRTKAVRFLVLPPAQVMRDIGDET